MTALSKNAPGNARLHAALLTFSAVVLWGAAPIGTRYLLGDTHQGLPAAAFAGLRYGLASLFFLPWAVQALRSWPRQDLLRGALLGVIGVAGYNLPNALGTRTVSAGMVGLLNAAEPLIIVLLIVLRTRRLPRVFTLGAAALGFAGIWLLATSAGPAQGDLKGVAYSLLAAFDWSLYCVLAPGLLARHSAAQVSAVTMILGTLPMLAAGAPQMGTLLTGLTPQDWALTAAIAIGPSAVALVAWNAGAAKLGPEASGWFLYLLPVISVAGGVAFLAEPFTSTELIGGVMILVSVFLSQRA